MMFLNSSNLSYNPSWEIMFSVLQRVIESFAFSNHFCILICSMILRNKNTKGCDDVQILILNIIYVSGFTLVTMRSWRDAGTRYG